MFRKTAVFPFLLLISLLLIACGESEPDPDQEISSASFDDVCKGVGLNKAVAYAAADAEISQIVVVSDSTIGAQYDNYSTRFTDDMPEVWFPQIVDGLFDYSNVELVACIHRTEVVEASACPFEDGYTLNVYNSTYELTVRAMQTAEILSQETVVVNGSCPTIHFFDDGETEDVYYPELSDEQIQAVIQPLVESK